MELDSTSTTTATTKILTKTQQYEPTFTQESQDLESRITLRMSESISEIQLALRNENPTKAASLLTHLLTNGWNPNTDLHDKTPLIVLFAYSPHLVKLLLDHGADPNLPGVQRMTRNFANPNPKTALTQAVLAGQLDSVNLLLDAGASDFVALYAALYASPREEDANSVEIMRVVVERLGKFVNSPQPLANHGIPRFDSVLQATLYNGGERMGERVKILLDAGADVEVEAFNEEFGVLEWAKEELGEESEVYRLLREAREKQLGGKKDRMEG